MNSKFLELKVMYCKDLKSFNFFQKLRVYVLVLLESDDPGKKLKQNQQHRTPTDEEGDGDPEWKYGMQFDLSEVSFVDCDHIFIHFYLRHEGLYFGDKTIGEVRVPLKDLIQESSGIVRFVNYQVSTPDWKPNGLLNFSFKVYAKGEDIGIYFPTSEISGYSAVHHQHQSPEIQYPTSEVESSSLGVYYPSIELEDSPQETYHAAQVSYPSHGTQYSSHYPPAPAPHAYCPPSMLLPPPLLNQPPPLLHQPPPLLHQPPPYPHGACYHPPFPPWFHPQ